MGTKCPKCHSENPDDQRFCGECGTQLLPEEEISVSQTKTLQPDKSEEKLERIGNYKLLDIIGKGGMGTVYLAQQEKPIRRKIAIKVIKPGMDSKEVIARFESEQQALALMSHPNIAQVHDSGETEQGYPYFVMEYVPGIPITEYCDKNKMKTEDRLILFEQICDAIQHAHFKGIVHRDLKPSNILVIFQDNKHIPKVIDFGIAKALTGQGLTEKTLHTVHGVAIGTPIYMSPEQAELTGYDIDTRTDVYSLGVLLYELLIGVTPFEEKELEKAGLMETLRIIREEEPPKPSTRFGSLGDSSKEVAKKRSANEIGIIKQLKGDLDWIVMKAIEKDKQRRYSSAAEFATDIERYLNREPIQARPPSMAYRVIKYVRRHKTASIATISILLLLILFSIWNLTERQKAEQSLKESKYNFAIALMEKANAYAEQNKWQLVKLFAVNSLLYQIEAHKFLPMDDLNLPHEDQDWIFKYETARKRSPFAPKVLFPILSPHWTYLASPYDTFGVIKIWEVSSGKEIATLKGYFREVVSMSFNPDEKYLASGSRDGAVKIWDVLSGKEIATLKGHERLVASVSFSPNRRFLASGSWDSTVKIWDLYSGKEFATLRGHKAEIDSIRFSPDGAFLISRSKDEIVKIWDVSSGKEIATLRKHEDAIISVNFSPNGVHLVSKSKNGTVKIWEVSSGKEVALLKGVRSPEAFSTYGKLIATGMRDSSIKIWDISSGREIATLKGHEKGILSLDFNTDGNYLASGSKDETVKIWEVSSGKEIATLIGNESPVQAVGFSPNGKKLYAENMYRLIIWELSNGKKVSISKGYGDAVISKSFSDVKKLIKEVEKQTGFSLDVLTPVPIKRVTLGQD